MQKYRGCYYEVKHEAELLAGIAHGVPYRTHCAEGKKMKRAFICVLAFLSFAYTVSLVTSARVIEALVFFGINAYCVKLFWEDDV